MGQGVDFYGQLSARETRTEGWKSLFLVNPNRHLQNFWRGGKKRKKSWKSPNSLVDERVLTSNPVFPMISVSMSPHFTLFH